MAAHEQQRPVTTRRERLLAAVLRDGGEWTTSRAARLARDGHLTAHTTPHRTYYTAGSTTP
ncbi:hypothetical protein N0X72_25480 [Streptomyces carpaticus]|uniref:hypothetical protein n=1 Tax=Streptomyces carpaticus TaxID=285558 RepID=UPI00220CE837|nr:hypothetical protein N0X72_25480 [Streptomyces carpaticus]